MRRGGLHSLDTVLCRVGGIDMDYQIAGTLGRFASSFPAETLRCARLLVDGGMSPMKVHALMYRHDLHRIIRAALKSANQSLRQGCNGVRQRANGARIQSAS